MQAGFVRRSATGAEGGRALSVAGELPDPLQTIVWARDLDKVDPRDIEACEDLLDAYFLMAKPSRCHATLTHGSS